MKAITKILFFCLFVLFISCKDEHNDLPDGIYADIETDKGDIIVQLEYEKTPVTVANFISLAEGKNSFVEEQYKGKPFYNGLKFHRVISKNNGDSEDFMIQGGDPMGTGEGGPGYKFKDEFHHELLHDKPGVLSMANAGINTNGSQFFITIVPTPWLDSKHTVFGHVVEGQDIVNSIVQNDSIKSITIIRKGSNAKKFDAEKVFKEYYTTEAENQKEITEKVAKVSINNRVKFENLRMNGTKTESGIVYEFDHKGEGKKPDNGTEVLINYSGYFESGDLLDTSILSIAESYYKVDPQKLAMNGYTPIAFPYGSKQGLIQGFIEALELMSYNDKLTVYIPSNLAWGEQGNRAVPPNANVIFEIELLENQKNKE